MRSNLTCIASSRKSLLWLSDRNGGGKHNRDVRDPLGTSFNAREFSREGLSPQAYAVRHSRSFYGAVTATY